MLALAAAATTGAALALAPLGATSSCATSSAGATTCTSGCQSLVASEGTGVLLVLAAPMLVTLVPVLWPARRARVAAAALLSVAAALALASVGIFLLPTLALAWAAVAAERHGEDAVPASSA